mmetsp:Transcript_20609/g.21389  ORF Transcript_20609/g.21389 Transcript_20609/m.21389 type:complete len:286 (-) Transcript_20609:25-882(-)
MGSCYSQASKQAVITSKQPPVQNSNNKIERCFATRTFNFDNQNLLDLNFLDDYMNHKSSSSNDGQIQANVISVHNNKLSSLPNFFMSNTTGLKKLVCSKNQFTEIPQIVFNQVTIKTLDFSNNQINSLSYFLSNISNLTELVMSNNQISKVPSCVVEMSQLQLVDLSNNNLTTYQKEFVLMRTHTLILSNNKIEKFEEPDSKEDWKSNERLMTLDLGGNLLSEVPSGLLKNSSVALLNLKGNKISYYDLKKVDGFEQLMERRKKVKDQGFIHNLEVEFDVCGLEI